VNLERGRDGSLWRVFCGTRGAISSELRDISGVIPSADNFPTASRRLDRAGSGTPDDRFGTNAGRELVRVPDDSVLAEAAIQSDHAQIVKALVGETDACCTTHWPREFGACSSCRRRPQDARTERQRLRRFIARLAGALASRIRTRCQRRRSKSAALRRLSGQLGICQILPSSANQV
jgi:hypothetical protein